MYVSTKRLILRLPAVVRSALWLGLALALALSAQVGLGQDNPADQAPTVRAQGEQEPQMLRPAPDVARTQWGDAVEDGLLFGDQFSGRRGDAYGALFRAGVWTGPAVGRTETIVPMEIMPYGFLDKTMVFGSLRGFRAASDGWGMNLGGGVRFYSEKWDRIFGANVFYDYDNSSGALFREMGFGFESLGAFWDMRVNGYIPVSTKQHLLKTELVDGSQRFVDHRLLFDNLLTFGNALRGVDLELGFPIPGRVPTKHNLKVFGGWYYYNGTATEGFSGWKARAQADVLQNVNLNLEVLSDQIFDTSVVFGATWTYGGYKQPDDQPRTQFDRMTEMVRRNYNVVVARIPQLEIGKVAINPLTDQPYFFEHVASYAPLLGADGTIDHPWQTLAQAEAALNASIPAPADQAGNIIYVHANSVYATAPDNTVTLIPTVRILGEGNGVQHVIRVPALGNILLPRATNFANRPLFMNQLGNAVTLVSGTSAAPSEFSGFQIGDPTAPASGPLGVGIFGDGVGNIVVNQTDVNFAQGDGVFLNNVTGPVAMLGTTINNVGNTNTAIDGLHIVGGTSRIFFGLEPITLRRSTILNTGGYALEIDGTVRGSLVNMTGSDIIDGVLATATTPAQTSGGILLNDIDGVVVVDSATIVNSVVSADTTGRAIDIQGTAATPLTPPRGLGQISFVGGIAIDNPEGDAIRIQDMQSDATVTPNLVSNVRFILPNPVNGVLAPGIRISNRNAGGINMLNNSGNIAFLEPVSITANGAPLAAAIDFEGNSGAASFLSILPSSSPNQILISGGGGDGIRIGATAPNANTSIFRVTGSTSIQQIAGTSIQIGDPTAVLVNYPTGPLGPPVILPPPPISAAQVSFDDIGIDNRGGIGIQVIDYVNSVQFTGTTTVGNTTNSLFTAVDIRANQDNPTTPPANQTGGDVIFGNLNILAAQGPTVPPIITGAGLNVLYNPRSVVIQQLNINQNSLVGTGTALFADTVGTRPAIINTTSAPPRLGLSIGSGTIFADGGPAVMIQNSTIGVQLTAVNSLNSSADGIFLSNNVGPASAVQPNAVTIHPTIFNVTGIANNLGSGGLIQGAALEGAYILNSEGVQLRNMDFIGNQLNGIYATTPSLAVLGNRINGNAGFGINVFAQAVELTQNNRLLQTVAPNFLVQGSTITNNGLVGAGFSGTQQILFTAATRGDYTVTIGAGGLAGQNIITHTWTPGFANGINEPRPPATTAPAPLTDDGVLIRTLGGAIGSRLNLSVVNNNITVLRPAAAGLTPLSDFRLDWNGVVNTGTIHANTFNFGADAAQGLVLNLQSTSAAANFRIAGNTFNAPTGDAKTGIDVTTNGGPSNIQIGALDGFQGNVMNFIALNNIIVNGRADDEAMRFNLGANSNVNIFNNQITMTGTDAEGMQFVTVAGPTNVRLDNNTIDLTGGRFNLFGIRFLSVTSGTLNLFGTVSNDITINGQTGSTFPWFFAPGNGVNGQTNINGVLVP